MKNTRYTNTIKVGAVRWRSACSTLPRGVKVSLLTRPNAIVVAMSAMYRANNDVWDMVWEKLKQHE